MSRAKEIETTLALYQKPRGITTKDQREIRNELKLEPNPNPAQSLTLTLLSIFISRGK